MAELKDKLPIRVSTEGTAGPYILVPVDQLETVEELLKAHKFRFWTDADAIAVDHEPAIAVVNLGLHGDAVAVEKILRAANLFFPEI